MQALYDSWDKNKYVMLAVNSGQHPSAPDAYVKDHAYTFPVLVDPDAKVSRDYFVRNLPTTYIIGTDGKIKQVVFGAR